MQSLKLNPMPLDASQTEFARGLLDPAAPVPAGIVCPNGNTAPKRFAVYRNNVTVSLTDALATGFPAIQRIVGKEFFSALARGFVRAHPPTTPVLMFYGEAFPAFLENFEPVVHLPYLADIARLEQARRVAFHAADAAPLAPDFLSTIAPEKLGDTRFRFHPSAEIITSNFPLLSIWEWNSIDNEVQKPAIPETGESVLVARPEMDVEVRRLPPGGAAFLQALHNGETFGAAAADGAAVNGFDLTLNITGLIESRIVINFTCNGDDDQ